MAEPIQVGFSGKGKKGGPNKRIVIPPERAGLRILLSVCGTILTALVGFYVMLPPLNLRANEFYYYVGLVLLSFPVFLFLFSGASRQPEYTPFVRKTSTIPMIILGVVVVFFGLAWVISSPFFQAKAYSSILEVKEVDFEKEMNPVDFTSIPKLDEGTALGAANRALGDMAQATGNVSQFVLSQTNTQINYESKPYRVVTLSYANLIKWFTNTREGLPGYILVNMDTRTTKFVESSIHYSDQEHFGKLLKRHLRFAYPTKMFGTAIFEVDDAGKPWWVAPVMTKRAGLLGGEDITGIVLVDPNTGVCAEYTMEQINGEKKADLQWIDRIYAGSLLTAQYNYKGKYNDGFWNSILGQKNVTIVSPEFNYIAQDDDVWMYTGITSITTDESIIGFIMVNQRTKETLYYKDINGATEISAKGAAETLVSDLGWKASFPLLINVGNEPTYFLSLKNEDDTVVNGFAMVHVVQYGTIKVTGSTLQECVQNYVAAVKKADLKDFDESKVKIPSDTSTPSTTKPDDNKPDPTPTAATASGTIAEIRSQAINGTSVYYIKLAQGPAFYSISAAVQEDVIFYAVGDAVEITYAPGNKDAKTLTAEKIAVAKTAAQVIAD